MTKAAVITSKGQVTIPIEIRKQLGLTNGKKVLFILDNGSVRLVPDVENPLKELENLRNHIQFSTRELKSLLKESKNAWEKLHDVS